MSNINPNNSNEPNLSHLTPAYLLFLQKLVGAHEAAGITTVEVATKIGISEADVSSGESGQRPLDFLEVRAWLRALDVNITDFTETLLCETLEKTEEVEEGGE